MFKFSYPLFIDKMLTFFITSKWFSALDKNTFVYIKICGRLDFNCWIHNKN
jgi:hypothetical protein